MRSAVVVGLGELGGVFAHGLLRTGRMVVPVTRDVSTADALAAAPAPDAVVVAVGEEALPTVLPGLPPAWRAHVVLLQNELLPDVWRGAVERPTIAAVWFEKKRGTGITPILPTVVAGPAAPVLLEALAALGVPAERRDESRATDALAEKNLYVVAANLAGLAGWGDTVGAVARAPRLRALGDEVLDVMAARVAAVGGGLLDRVAAWATWERAVAADPGHGARGRTAAARLDRMLAHADALGVDVPETRAIAAAHAR